MRRVAHIRNGWAQTRTQRGAIRRGTCGLIRADPQKLMTLPRNGASIAWKAKPRSPQVSVRLTSRATSKLKWKPRVNGFRGRRAYHQQRSKLLLILARRASLSLAGSQRSG